MRRVFLPIFGFFLFLTGCSAVDINRLSPDGQSILSQIEVPAPSTRLEQFFTRSFDEYRSYQLSRFDYKLSYVLKSTETGTLSVSGSSSNLRNKDMTLTYQLTDVKTGEVVDKGMVTAKATSGAVSGFYAQEQSAKQADERLARLLGQRLGQLLYTRLTKKTASQ